MVKRRIVKAANRWIQIAFSVLVISSLIAGCRPPWQDQPEPTPPEVEVFDVVQAPDATQEPRADLPPALVEVFPNPASSIALDQPITLIFNQAMDAASVEAAISFEPRISGRFTWEDVHTVTFSPDEALMAGSRLNLALDTSAQAANQLNLQDQVELDFQIAEPLKVVQTLPANDSKDVDPESVIFVAFNQPVVALGDPSDVEPAFTLEPEVPGKGEWLNTSTYIFTPEPTMNGGTKYTLQLNENLAATSGAGFSRLQSLEFDFTTAHPAVLKARPLTDKFLSLDGPIQINFNIQMNSGSVEEHFSLIGQNEGRIPGTFEWADDYKKVTFIPDRLLSRESFYTAQLGSGAESSGGLPIVEAINSTWLTYPAFAVDISKEPVFESYYGGFGQYKITFTAPLGKLSSSDPEAINHHITIDPDLPGFQVYATEDSLDLWINGYFRPETTYTLNLGAGLQDEWGDQLGEVFTTSFVTPPAPSSINLLSGYSAYNLIFTPASTSELILQATNISEVSLDIAPISIDDLITLIHPDNYRYREIFLPEVRESITHNLNLPRNRREVVALPLSYDGEPLKPGIYYLGVHTPDITENDQQSPLKYTLIVSEHNLVMKVAPDQAFVWATRLDDLTPLTDAPVVVYDTEGKLLTRGSLDSHGRFIDDFSRVEGAFSSYFTLVGEPGEADFAFSISSWQDAYHLYEQGIDLDTLPPLLDAYIYTDRPIYRPGDMVYFKTVVFSRDNGLPVRSGYETVTMSIQGDPGMLGRSTTFYSKALALSSYGTAAGSTVLPADVPPGHYRVDVSIEDELINVLFFDVASYRKPEIDLSVGFKQTELLIGEDIGAEARADYFFGLPAAGQSFSWTLYQQDTYFHLPGYRVGPLDEIGVRPFPPSFSPLGDAVSYGEGKTDDEGQLSLLFTADDLELEDVKMGLLQQYNLEVTVMDQSGFPVSFRDAILVHPETFYIGVQPDAYFRNAGSLFNFSVLTVGWDKQSVADIPLEAAFEAIRWTVEETGNPETPYRYVAQTTLIGGASPVTDQEGQARLSFTPPDPGTYRLTVESGEAVTQILVWVSGEGAAVWPTQQHNKIDLTSDARDYQPGQIAQIFIPNPFPGGARALVTTERGRVMTSQILEISDAGTTVAVPITQESIPNIYVSAILIGKDATGKPDFRQGNLELTVAPFSKILDVDLSLDTIVSAPGEPVTLTLRISDQQGNPIQGEFSIVVVDKALLALVPPNSPSILEAIYGQVSLSVQTSLSLHTYAKQLGLIPLEIGGLGGGVERAFDAAIREDFPDTAFWQADVITATDGTAQLSIRLPDNLTTWVVEVRGLTEDYLVGQAETEVQTQKPLMIRPVTPRFLVDGDLLEMAAVVHNNTDEELDVDVSLMAAGFKLADANPTKRVSIESGQSMRITWWGTVESVEAVELVFQAVSGQLIDASKPIWGDLQVKRYNMPQTFSSTGQLDEAGGQLELVSLPISTDPSSGDLSLVLNPSLLAALLDGLEAMEGYPYRHTVSILSRLMANLNVYEVLSKFDADSVQLSTSLNELIEEDINQLISTQNFDGGWSWWRSSSVSSFSSDPFITAYVLLGLEAATEAGMEIEDDITARAKDHLINHMPQPEAVESGWELDRLLFLAYAMRTQNADRENDFDLGTTLDGLYTRRSELNPWGLGLLALTMRERGGMNARVNTLVAELEIRALRSATSVHWESMGTSWMLPGTPIYNTAVVVYALAQLDPASTSLPLALRYLMAHRNSQGLWSSSFESSWVLMAAAKAMQGTGDYQADFDFTAQLNNILIAEGTAVGHESLKVVTASASIDALYPESPNALLIERGEGTGTLYYRVDLQAYHPAATAPAIQRGISLHRDYYLGGPFLTGHFADRRLGMAGCPGNEGCEPIDSIMLDPDDPSQLIRVVLTMNLSHDMYNLVVQDFIPAGTEILNRGLLTAQSIPEEGTQNFDPRDPFAKGWGWWYFNQAQIYDDHILWTADYVPAGTYILTYELLPYQRGVYQVLPAHAWQYYYPEVQGTSFGDLFKIE